MKRPKWILLVEDDERLAALTTLALGPDKSGYDVVVAHDGLEALDCLYRRGSFRTDAAGRPAFILLDLDLPKVDGLEVLQQIRADRRLKNLPVVIFTSSREPDVINRSYELGANAYVFKPVEKYTETLNRIGAFWGAENRPPTEAVPLEVGAPEPPQLATAV